MDYTGIKNDIKIRDRLYIIQKKNPIPENFINYKQYKNKNLAKQRKTERGYYHEQFEIHQHDLKKSWKVLKNIIGKEDNHTIKKQTVFLKNNQYTTDRQTIANTFNISYHHSCRSHATNTAFISSTTLRCLSIHLAVAPEISTSWYQYPFSLGFS